MVCFHLHLINCFHPYNILSLILYLVIKLIMKKNLFCLIKTHKNVQILFQDHCTQFRQIPMHGLGEIVVRSLRNFPFCYFFFLAVKLLYLPIYFIKLYKKTIIYFKIYETDFTEFR